VGVFAIDFGLSAEIYFVEKLTSAFFQESSSEEGEMFQEESRQSVPAGTGEVSKWLFWTCFIALVATSFGFIIRANIIGDLGVHFNLSETQKGEIL
jgi:hypothetical protein